MLICAIGILFPYANPFSCLIEILQIYKLFRAVKDQNPIQAIHRTVIEGHANRVFTKTFTV